MRRTTPLLAAITVAVLALAGCASSGSSGGGSSETTAPSAVPSDSPSGTPAAGGADLMVSDSSLGKIVVDSKGMTVYFFDQDTAGSGKSACAGQCLANWPPVPPAADTPTVDGVTGELGTITASDGSTQITLNGLPLYYWIGDRAPGDVNGQAVQNVWWVVSPDGKAIH